MQILSRVLSTRSIGYQPVRCVGNF